MSSVTLTDTASIDLVDILSTTVLVWPQLIRHPDDAVSSSPIEDFLTKKQVEERFGRSHRSLTRDYSKAVRVGDSAFLRHLKLRTEDGAIRDGTEVTLEEIQVLSNRGMTPTWYIESAWAERQYGDASKTRKPKNGTTASNGQRSVAEGESGDHTDSSLIEQYKQRLQEKDEVIADLKADKTVLREQLTSVTQLTDNITKLLGHSQIKALGLPETQLQTKPRSEDKVYDAELIAADVPSKPNIPKAAPAKKSPATPKKASGNKRSQPNAKPKSAKKALPSKKRKPAQKRPRTERQKPRKPKWYETPTIDRFLNR